MHVCVEKFHTSVIEHKLQKCSENIVIIHHNLAFCVCLFEQRGTPSTTCFISHVKEELNTGSCAQKKAGRG